MCLWELNQEIGGIGDIGILQHGTYSGMRLAEPYESFTSANESGILVFYVSVISGNVVYESDRTNIPALTGEIADLLLKAFGENIFPPSLKTLKVIHSFR